MKIVSHTDTEGFHKILDKIKEILKPGGEIFLTLCSKETYSFSEANYSRIDENTVKTEEGPGFYRMFFLFARSAGFARF